MKPYAVLICFFLVLALTVSSQSNPEIVTGTVTDFSKMPVSQAEIMLSLPDTVLTTHSNPAGQFELVISNTTVVPDIQHETTQLFSSGKYKSQSGLGIIKIYNLLGRCVITLPIRQGLNKIELSDASLASGKYFLIMNTPEYSARTTLLIFDGNIISHISGRIIENRHLTENSPLKKAADERAILYAFKSGYDNFQQFFTVGLEYVSTEDTLILNRIPVEIGTSPDSISSGYDLTSLFGTAFTDDQNGDWYVWGSDEVRLEGTKVVAVNPDEHVNTPINWAYQDGDHRIEGQTVFTNGTPDPVDNTPPTLSSILYNNTSVAIGENVTNVDIDNSVFKLIFNDPSGVSINPDSVKIYTELGDIVESETVVSGSTVTVRPVGNLAYGTDYYVGVGGVSDGVGNRFSGYTLDFKTENQPVQMVKYGGRVWDTDSLLIKTAPNELNLWAKWFNGGQGNRVEGSKQGNIHNFLFEVLQGTHIDSVQFGFEYFNGIPASFIRTIYSPAAAGNETMDIAVKTYLGLGDVSPEGYSVGNLEANFDERGNGAKPLEQGMVWYLVKNCPNSSAVPFTDQQWHDLLDHIDRINSYRAEPLQVIADSSANGFYPTTEAEAEGKILVYRSLTHGAGSISYQVRDNRKYFVNIALLDPTSLDHAVEEEGVSALTSLGFTKTPLLRNPSGDGGLMFIYEGNHLTRAPSADKTNILFWEAIEKNLGGLGDGMSHQSILKVQY